MEGARADALFRGLEMSRACMEIGKKHHIWNQAQYGCVHFALQMPWGMGVYPHCSERLPERNFASCECMVDWRRVEAPCPCNGSVEILWGGALHQYVMHANRQARTNMHKQLQKPHALQPMVVQFWHQKENMTIWCNLVILIKICWNVLSMIGCWCFAFMCSWRALLAFLARYGLEDSQSCLLVADLERLDRAPFLEQMGPFAVSSCV